MLTRNKSFERLVDIVGGDRVMGELMGLSRCSVYDAIIGRRPLRMKGAIAAEKTTGAYHRDLVPGTDGSVSVAPENRTKWNLDHFGIERADWTYTKDDFLAHRRRIDVFAEYRIAVLLARTERYLRAMLQADCTHNRRRFDAVVESYSDAVSDLETRFPVESGFYKAVMESPEWVKKGEELANVKASALRKADAELGKGLQKLRDWLCASGLCVPAQAFTTLETLELYIRELTEGSEEAE